MSRRPRLRSVRTKLALVFFAIITAAFGLLYFIATPQLESKLEQRQLDDIQLVRPGRAPAAEGGDLRGLQGEGAQREDARLRRGDGRARDAAAASTSTGSSTRCRTRAPRRTRPSTARCRARRSGHQHAQTEIGPLAGEELAQVAQPFFRGRKRKRPVAVAFYARDLNDVAEAVDLVRNRVLVATGVALALALVGRVPGGAGARAAHGAPRGGGRRGRARALHRPAAGRLPGRARPADAHVQPDAGAAAAGGRRAQGVHRDRLARAAHADLLAGGIRRAAPGRGPRRGHPARVPRDDERAGGAPAEAVRGPARPVAPRRRVGRAAPRAGRPVRAGAQHRQRVHAGARRPRHRPRDPLPNHGPEALCDPVRVAQIMRILLDNALRHTPGGHAGDRGRRAQQRHGGPDRDRQRPRAARTTATRRSSSASTPATPRAAPGSGSRSRASWPSGWTGGCG